MGYWAKDEFGREQYYYGHKDRAGSGAGELVHILYNYSDYTPDGDKINLLSWARNWEYFLDSKVDFDTALKSLSPRQQRFMGLIKSGVSNYELERRGYYKPKSYKWLCLEQMANYLNGD